MAKPSCKQIYRCIFLKRKKVVFNLNCKEYCTDCNVSQMLSVQYCVDECGKKLNVYLHLLYVSKSDTLIGKKIRGKVWILNAYLIDFLLVIYDWARCRISNRKVFIVIIIICKLKNSMALNKKKYLKGT